MENGGIEEGTLMRLRIEAVCRGPVISCAPDLDLPAAARLMDEREAPALLAAGDGEQGLFSRHELSRLLAEHGATAGRRLCDHMGERLETVGSDDYVFEAVLKMARYDLPHLGVVERGKIVGIVTATDLLKLQAGSPFFLHREIEQARSIEQLQALGGKTLDLVRLTLAGGIRVKTIVQLISGLNDAIALRLIGLLDSCEGIRLPAGAAYLVLGSEGRGEQTLRTDQDNAIVCADLMPPEQLGETIRFANRLVDALEQIGVPRCRGNIMASSPRWRHSLTEWSGLVREWIDAPTPENMLSFGMLQDLRPLHGEQALGLELRDRILTAVQRHGTFFINLALHAVRFPPPFTLFGRIRVESGGKYCGMVDLKKSGIFPITVGATILGLEAGIIGGNTWDKLDRLCHLGVISCRDLEIIEAAFSFLIRLRLQRQLEQQCADPEAARHVDPQALSPMERGQLRQALEGVSTFLWIFRDHYNLDYTSI